MTRGKSLDPPRARAGGRLCAGAHAAAFSLAREAKENDVLDVNLRHRALAPRGVEGQPSDQDGDAHQEQDPPATQLLSPGSCRLVPVEAWGCAFARASAHVTHVKTVSCGRGSPTHLARPRDLAASTSGSSSTRMVIRWPAISGDCRIWHSHFGVHISPRYCGS